MMQIDVSDFKDFNLEAEQRAAVPYYVDATFENLGDTALIRHLLEPSVEDADGQEYKPVNCSAILLSKGKQLERVRFHGDVTQDPVFWSPA